MKHTLLIAAGLVALGLSACDKPTVIVPSPVVAPPGPAGPQGPTGNTGETGRPGEPAAVIVMPPASAPSS